MSIQNPCLVWIHGIGNAQQGYSLPWREALDPYLEGPGRNVSSAETLWSGIFSRNEPLTAQETVAKTAIYKILGALPDFILDPDSYVGEFVPYLVRPEIRTNVNQTLSDVLLALSNTCDSVSIIAHSWGSVVAYETLRQLATDQPTFRLTNLFTLGSPLRYVELFLANHPGPKPTNTTTWVNIEARGDLIGSLLKPHYLLISNLLDLGFEVDVDLEVDNFGNQDAHGSYFLKGNVVVLRDTIATTILQS